jgi:hypothetical protein
VIELENVWPEAPSFGKGDDYVIDFRKDSRSADGTFFIRTAADSSNITIRGRGTIDGKGIVMALATSGIINGYEDGTFRADKSFGPAG